MIIILELRSMVEDFLYSLIYRKVFKFNLNQRNMATKTWAIFLVLFCTLLTSVGQVFFKLAADFKGPLLDNYFILIGFVLFASAGFLLVFAFKHGELSVLYPLIATSYIFVSLFSIYFFNETMNLFKWAGVFVIIVGIIFLGIGGSGIWQHSYGQ